MLKELQLRDLAHLSRLKRAIEFSIDEFGRAVPSRWRDAVTYALAGGHRTRGVACLLACESVGGTWRSAVPLSVAIELLHKASVIHDDIADKDEFRKGRASHYRKFGIPLAIAVSDFLLSSAFKQAESISPADSRYPSLFAKAFYSMATGQLNDVVGGVFEEPGTEEWGANHLLKTGSLAALSFEAGALTGGGSADQVTALTAFGASLGLAFQLINDTRSLLDRESGRIGLSSDLRNGKITPLVSWARHVADPCLRTEIDGMLNQSSPLAAPQVMRLKSILIDLGAHSYIDKQVELLLAEARRDILILEDSMAKHILSAGSVYSTFARLTFL